MIPKMLPAHETVTPTSTYAPWRDDEAFQETLRLVRGITLVDMYRLWELWMLVAKSAQLHRGVIIEVGCWLGGTAALIGRRADLCRIREPFHVYDTFKGIPPALVSASDPYYHGGEHAATREGVFQTLARFGVKNFQCIAGIFPNSSIMGPFDAVRFAHLDVDLYESAKRCTEAIFPRLVPGGMIVYDDYGFRTTPGVTKYVNEVAAGTPYPVIHNLNGHAILIRT